jgi:carbamoyltransferase
MMVAILGLRFGHDAAASLVIDGEIVADAAEERFTRKKNDGSFPINAIAYCLSEGGISSRDLDTIAIPSTYAWPDLAWFFPGLAVKEPSPNQGPARKQPSLLQRFSRGGRAKDTPPKAVADPDPLATYMPRFPVKSDCQLVKVRHHLAHAASAYFTSGLEREQKSLVAVLDGIGDRQSVSLWRGEAGRLDLLTSFDSTGSLGWFYALVTEALGWRQSSDEWKVMGLAPYGEAEPALLAGLHPVFRDGELLEPFDFGRVDRYPDHGCHHYHMPVVERFQAVLENTTRENFAASCQAVAEQQALDIILPWLKREETRHLCCAGGFFLNVKLNGRIWQCSEVETQWVYPNPGDAGLAVGAALSAYHNQVPAAPFKRLEHLYLGPAFGRSEIKAALDSRHIAYSEPEDLPKTVAGLLADNRIVGWFQGRMESGPRALGGRSILMSPLSAENKDVINASVKYREAFRPFCPSMLDEARGDYLVKPREEPFMVTGFEARPERAPNIPAVVHVDGSLRPQTVTQRAHPRYHALIKAFGDLTGEPLLLNTSFNVKGEPIVCTPSDALRCFFDTGLDYLALGDFLIKKPGIA